MDHPQAQVRWALAPIPPLGVRHRFRERATLGYLRLPAAPAAGSQIGGARRDPTLAALPDRNSSHLVGARLVSRPLALAVAPFAWLYRDCAGGGGCFFGVMHGSAERAEDESTHSRGRRMSELSMPRHTDHHHTIHRAGARIQHRGRRAKPWSRAKSLCPAPSKFGASLPLVA